MLSVGFGVAQINRIEISRCYWADRENWAAILAQPEFQRELTQGRLEREAVSVILSASFAGYAEEFLRRRGALGVLPVFDDARGPGLVDRNQACRKRN